MFVPRGRNQKRRENMEKFVYEYATKVYFGEGAAREHLAAAVSAYGPNVMLAYGGGSSQICHSGSGLHQLGSPDAGDFRSI